MGIGIDRTMQTATSEDGDVELEVQQLDEAPVPPGKA